MGSKSVTSSYWYKLILHLGLCKGPIDWLGQIRGGDRIAWTGRQRTSGIVRVQAADLYGGPEAEGGIEGDFELMMGTSDQMPNSYLAAHIGPSQGGYRGRATIVIRGAKLGAGNPYPKTLYFKLCRILKGWDDDVCWYPPKAPVPIRETTYVPPGSGGGDEWYRWAFKQGAAPLLSVSPDGSDWTDPTTFPAAWVSGDVTVLFGETLVSTNSAGGTKYAPWNTVEWVDGPASGGIGGILNPTACVIGGRLFISRGTSGYSYSDNPTAGYTEVAGTTMFTFGNSDYVVRCTSTSYGNFKFSLDGGDSFDDGMTLDEPVQLFAGGGSAARTAVGGADDDRNPIIYYSDNGFQSKADAAMPSGLVGAVQVVFHVIGEEWLAFMRGDTPLAGAILRSTDDCESFQLVDLGFPIQSGATYQGGCDYDKRDGRLVCVVETADGNILLYTDDRVDWYEAPHGGDVGPANVFCIAPYDGEEPPTPEYGIYYMNPAHILYDSITSRRENGGMGEPIGRIDNASFTKAADRLYNEGFGICCTWYGGESTEQFQQRILNVCGGSLSQSRRDGKFYLDLLREVEDIDALPTITDDDINDWEAEPAVPPESINQIQVKWFDPETREQRITAPIQSLGAIQDAGGLFADIREYNEIPYEALANRVAQRDLNSVSSALWKLTFSCRRRSYDLRPGMQIRIMCPNRGFADMVVVIGDIDYGRIGEEEVRIIALQDVFALPEVSFVEPQGSLDDNPAPGDDDDNKTEAVIEAPYFQVISALTPSEYTDIVDETSGFLLTAKSAPPRGVNYRIYTKQGADVYATTANGDFCPSAKAVSDVPPLVEVDIAINSESLMDRVAVGDWALWDGEIRRVDAVAPGLVSLASGCADTLPRKHLAGSTILFVGEWVGTDEREYVDGEEVNVKLPAAGYGQDQALADATEHTLVFASRQARPYPPANLKINGVSIFALSGGTGGGGGGSPPGPVPTAPPATSANGVPASQVPGPGGGYPDDGPPMFPPPPTFGGDVAEGGDFSDPTSLAKWRNRDGTALSPAWGLLDDQLHLHASNGTYAAYNYATRFEAPHMPFPRHTITVTAPVASDPSVQTMVGIAYGLYGVGYMPTYESLSEPSLETGLVTHVFTHVVRNAGAGQGFAGQYPTINYMPVVKHIINGGLSNARVGNVTMTVDEFIPPVTAEAPAHLALDAGLTGWSLWPDPLDTNPYVADVSVSGGVAVFDFVHEFGAFRYLICEDPLVFADEMHKYVRIRGKVWCDDDSTAGTSMGTYTAGGVTFGLAYKLLDGTYTVSVGGRFERGDFTEREVWAEVGISAGLGISVHLCILAQAAPGKTCKVKDLECDSTDDAYPPEA